MVLSAIHACSGYGGMELGLKLAGISTRTACHIEWETHAASTLVARMEEALLDKAPVWSDVKTFPAELFAGKVDIVTAGFPCQPFSQAGLQQGLEDDRWLWPDIWRICLEVRPSYIFLENVPGLVKRGLSEILADLAEGGFDAEWGHLGAGEIGAPHRRERIWILAYANGNGYDGEWRIKTLKLHSDRRRSEIMVNTESLGNGEGNRSTKGAKRWKSESEIRGGTVANTESERFSNTSGWAGPELAGSSSCCIGDSNASRSLHYWPPGRDDFEGWERWISENGPEPSIRRIANGRPEGLVDALHLLGNGLVPQVAATAFLSLAGRAGLLNELQS